MHRVFLLAGTNLGNRVQNLENAYDLIAQHAGQPVRKSAVYKTAPWGKPDQPEFYNQALEILSRDSAGDLLEKLKKIELQMGRAPGEKWGERLIDLDILLYGDQIINDPGLIIPHPQMAHRRFTLEPLAEIAATVVHPASGRTIREMLDACTDTLKVTRL